MKKLFTLLGLTAVAGAMAVVAFMHVPAVKEADATTGEANRYIPFTLHQEGSAWSYTSYERWVNPDNPDDKAPEAPGGAVSRYDTYWTGAGDFFALDDFYKGEATEKWRGEITSPSWTQNSRYIYYTLGGNANVQIKFVAEGIGEGDTNVERTINNDIPNGNPMIVNYYEIPSDFISDAQLNSGVTMHLVLIDNELADYGFHNFGYLHVNASKADVAQAVWDHINYVYTLRSTEERRFRAHWVMQHYSGNGKYDGIRDYAGIARTNVDEDFEDNATFLANWYRDSEYNLGNFDGMNENTIISDFTHRVVGENPSNMPFNLTGDGFFKGFLENGQGFVPRDEVRYRFVSKPFILSGTGFVSIKMAGRTASLHVIRGIGRDSVDEHEIEYDLAWINLKTFNPNGDEYNIASSGRNCVTLVRHVINLSAFKGELIQLAIADTDDGGNWGAANFDELISYYPSLPNFQIDVKEQNGHHPYFLDKYVPSTHASAADGIDYREAAKQSTVDNSSAKRAADFLSSFYGTVRNHNNGLSSCGTLDLTSLKATYAEIYNGETADAVAKGLIDNAEDIDYSKSATKDNWFDQTPNESYCVGDTLLRLGFEGATPSAAPKAPISGIIEIDSTVMVIVIVAAVAALTTIAFFYYSKKRELIK